LTEKNSVFNICNAILKPGESANLALPMPERYSCSNLYMPIRVVHGLKKGPCVLIYSVLKGIELNGLEIANRVINSINPEQISGTVIAIPAMNIYALTQQYPAVMPVGYDLKNSFPGKESGTYGERIAYILTEEILQKTDYCIELQTGGLSHNILPQIYCSLTEETRELAPLFQTPVITKLSFKNHSLRQTLRDMQIPLWVYEAGEALRFDENAITLGINGIFNLMSALKMINKPIEQTSKPIYSKEEDWLVAPKSGILHPKVTLGQAIEKGDVIGVISDPFGVDIDEIISATEKSVVVGVNMAPLIHEGLPIFKLASFLDYARAEVAIEEWDKNQPDSFIG